MTPRIVLVVDDAPRVSKEIPEHTVIGALEYLSDPRWTTRKSLRVLNLCHHTQYRSPGYYASLLAEARGHRVIPSVRTLQDLSRKTLYGPDLEELGKNLDRALQGTGESLGDRFETVLFFGESPMPEIRALGRSLFEAYPAPILRVEFRRQGGAWQISTVRAVGLRSLDPEQRAAFLEALRRYMGTRWQGPRSKRSARYDLAILHDPGEELAPSDRKALARFIRAGRALSMDVELITRRDFSHLAEYDALFIRETTAVDHHTYRFARTAAAEGLVVIDDPDSILRCTNKIFLKEALEREGVPTPASVVLTKGDLDRAEAQLGYPMVLKIPDGSFSRGVFKVKDRRELEERSADLFKDSELLLAQAYTYTPFDWRVGVLAGEALFVCRYHMSRGHWQILKHGEEGQVREGAVDTLAVEDAPPAVIDTAVRAARVIGDGLYGVDLKETEKGVVVIEVNDNPNIDAGFEDAVLGDELYLRVMREFARRLDERTREATPRATSP